MASSATATHPMTRSRSTEGRSVVDGRRFDDLMRALYERGSRRRLVTRLLAGTGLGALFAGGQIGPAAAAKDKDDRKCRNKPVIDDRRCPDEDSICKLREDEVCACARTTGGSKKCVDITNEGCPTEDECDSNADCPGNRLCIEVGGCCQGSRRNLCVRPCGSGGGGGGGGGNSTTSEASAPLLGR